MPKVSVIVPVYNVEQYLSRCLTSLINQTLEDIEIIVDIWAEDSVTASTVLSQVEDIMRRNNYIMSFSNDVPNIGNLFHINNRFTTKV